MKLLILQRRYIHYWLISLLCIYVCLLFATNTFTFLLEKQEVITFYSILKVVGQFTLLKLDTLFSLSIIVTTAIVYGKWIWKRNGIVRRMEREKQAYNLLSVISIAIAFGVSLMKLRIFELENQNFILTNWYYYLNLLYYGAGFYFTMMYIRHSILVHIFFLNRREYIMFVLVATLLKFGFFILQSFMAHGAVNQYYPFYTFL